MINKNRAGVDRDDHKGAMCRPVRRSLAERRSALQACELHIPREREASERIENALQANGEHQQLLEGKILLYVRPSLLVPYREGRLCNQYSINMHIDHTSILVYERKITYSGDTLPTYVPGTYS